MTFERCCMWKRLGLATATASLLLLSGCGGNEPDPNAVSDPGAAPPPGGEAAVPGDAAPPPEGMPPEGMPPGDPGMAPGMDPGMPGMEAPGEGFGDSVPPSEQPPAVVAHVRPPFPSKGNPFDPIDEPVPVPPPVPPAPPAVRVQQNRVPIRPVIPPPQPVAEEGGQAVVPTGLRTSGILWGPTVKAIVQQGEQSWVVRPGDTVAPRVGDRTVELTVVAISSDGATLRDNRGNEYLAPLQSR